MNIVIRLSHLRARRLLLLQLLLRIRSLGLHHPSVLKSQLTVEMLSRRQMLYLKTLRLLLYPVMPTDVISLIRWYLGCVRLLNHIYLTLTTLCR